MEKKLTNIKPLMKEGKSLNQERNFPNKQKISAEANKFAHEIGNGDKETISKLSRGFKAGVAFVKSYNQSKSL